MMVIESDASNSGWEACSNNLTTGGQWSASETLLHINAKELLAAYLALKTFARDKRGTHIRLKIDNITAVYFINRRGGTVLMDITSQMWGWCMERKIYISAEHLPGKLNIVADVKSETRQLGVEAQPISVPATDVQTGSMPNRPVCFKAHNAAPRIFQLEARPQLGSDECSGSELVRSKTLCLPSVCSDREVSSQGKSTGTGVDCTSLANTTLVSTDDINADSAANTPPKQTNAPVESQERDTPSHPSGLTETGCLGCVRSSLQSQGVSDRASKLILASWRRNTESAYSANWGRWACWCQRNGYNPLSATIGAILDFLAHEFA